MIGIKLGLTYGGAPTLLQQALSAIRRNGGTLLMVPDNYAGVFEDSTGITPVDALGDPIGRINDRTGANNATQATASQKPVVGRVPKRLGSELAPNSGGFSSAAGWTTGAGTSISGGVAASTSVAAGTLTVGTGSIGTIGKAYHVVITVNSISGAQIRPVLFGNVLTSNVISSPGTYSFTVTASAADAYLQAYNGTLTSGLVTFSVREVLEWTNAISFDGVNDFLSTGITTGNEGWVCAGLSHNVAATAMAFSGGGESATNAGVCLRMADGSTGCQLMVSDGTTLQIVQSPTSITPGTVFVYDGGWTASTRFVAVNGTETSAAKSVNCTSALTARIGGGVAGGLPTNGPMTAIVYTPVLPSAADRALIRRWIGSLQGQTL